MGSIIFIYVLTHIPKKNEQPSNSVDQHNHMVFIIKGVEVLEIACGEDYGI
jgi:hypothetical protein